MWRSGLRHQSDDTYNLGVSLTGGGRLAPGHSFSVDIC